MREGIHPDYKPARVVCACGNVIETGSTQGDFQIDICAACHPFFTGKQKIMDTAGRIEKFKNRYGANPLAKAEEKKAELKAAAAAAAPAPAAKKAEPKENRAAKRAKTAKAKPKTEAAPAEASASEPKAE